MSTLAVNTITNAAGGNTAQINGMTPTADSLQGFRNRLINPGMVIDQRNAGAAVTASSAFPVDRWVVVNTANGAYSAQQNTSVPDGFNNSLLLTITTAQTAGTGNLSVEQVVEGFNIADLGWGTASAKTVTLSFWVRSSLTGTFGGAVRNSDLTRSYPYTYTISSANTWEYKTVTIEGDASGTWLTTNGRGAAVRFSLFAPTGSQQTAGVWFAGNASGATGQTQLASTNGATFYITGVQLEAGSVATPFERRPFGTELQLCQRYFALNTPGCGRSTSTTAMAGTVGVPVTMRASPTATLFNGTSKVIDIGVAFRNITSLTVLEGASPTGGNITSVVSTTTSGVVHTYMGAAFAFSAEL
jgi:hypothetical protein